MTIASKEPKTEEAKKEGELTAAKRLYESVNLHFVPASSRWRERR